MIPPARILVVDDQPANVLLLHRILTTAGFEVKGARAGGEALAAAQESPPDLILLDMHLPDMHGLEVLRRLRESTWGTGLRVVAMSALSSAEDHALWLQAGCMAAIEKPITIKTFLEQISRWLPGAGPPAERAEGVGPPAERVEEEAPKRERLGEFLVANGLLTPQQLAAALTAQAGSGKRLGQILVERREVDEDDIAWALSTLLGYPYVFLSPDTIDQEAVRLLPETFLRQRRVLPVLRFGQEMTLAMADPTDQRTVDEVAGRTGLQVNRALALTSNIEGMLDRLVSRREEMPVSVASTEAQYLQFHLVQALQQGASEIHFDPATDGQGRVRYRLHGVLVDRAGQSPELHAAILRYLRDLTAAEAPVGTAAATVMVREADIHLVATFLPTATGPAVTLALYPIRTEVPDLTPLGVSEDRIRPLREALHARRGVVLVGCGDRFVRSTLLHALIPPIQGAKVWVLERLPIYRRPTLNQTVLRAPDEVVLHLHAAADAAADMIVVDDVAPGAALVAAHEVGRTRMVLAAHPQDDVAGLLSQALDAAGPALVSSTLKGILAARAVRLLCPTCKQASPEGSGGLEARQTFIPQGCEACGFTGFRGQHLLVAVWAVDPETRLLLGTSRTAAAFERVIRETGPQMRAQGVGLVEDGLISLEELARVVGEPWTSQTSSF